MPLWIGMSSGKLKHHSLELVETFCMFPTPPMLGLWFFADEPIIWGLVVQNGTSNTPILPIGAIPVWERS